MIKDLADNKPKEVPLIHDNRSHIFFLCAHATLIKINHVINQHKNLNKFQEQTTQGFTVTPSFASKILH